jgi:undecaprenyl-diphosphatase
MRQQAAERARTRLPTREITFPWWLVAVLAGAFVALAVIARGGNTLQVDLDVSQWVQARTSPFAEQLAELGNFLGDRVFAISLLVVAWVGLALIGLRADLWFVTLVVLGRIIALPLKPILDSPRPTIEQVVLNGTFEDFGFPSGHALTASLTLGSIAILVGRHTDRHTVWYPLLAIWIGGTALTAYARIWYGAHWFTDTLGGATLGFAIVMTAANLSERIAGRPDPNTNAMGPK